MLFCSDEGLETGLGLETSLLGLGLGLGLEPSGLGLDLGLEPSGLGFFGRDQPETSKLNYKPQLRGMKLKILS